MGRSDLVIGGDTDDLQQEHALEMAQRYLGALKADHQEKLKNLYNRSPEALLKPVTISGDTAIHIAAYKGDVKLLRELLAMVPPQRIRDVLTKKDAHGNTPLHEVANGSIGAAKLLVRNLMVLQDGKQPVHEKDMRERVELLKVRNNLGETPIYKAASVGNMEVLQFLVQEAELLGDMKEHFHRNDSFSILHIAIIGQHFEAAIWLLRKYEDTLANKTEQFSMTSLGLLASMPTAFESSCPRDGFLEAFLYFCLPKLVDDKVENVHYQASRNNSTNASNALHSCLHYLDPRRVIPCLYRSFWDRLAQAYETVQTTKKLKQKHHWAKMLARILVEKDTSWMVTYDTNENTICIGGEKQESESTEDSKTGKEDDGDDTVVAYSTKKKTSPSLNTPLLIAASKGIKEIIALTLDMYPQAIDHVNRSGENILHAAIRHRQRTVFDMVTEQNITAVDKLAVTIDSNGYTVLHHAADTSHYQGGTQPGAALQLQEELIWFQDVKKLIPSHYEMHRNKDGLTAEKLFEVAHEEQYKEAKEWVSSIAQSCSTVAVLVATVVFTAAFTVPGGFRGEEEDTIKADKEKKEGLPILLDKPLYSLFTVMDVASLAASLTSLVLFLSILTSSMEKKDFLRTLPQKLTFAFNFLFFSVATAMVAFTSTILLTIRPRKQWTKTLNYVATFLPIFVFVIAQYPLYGAFYGTFKDIIKQLYRIILPLKCKILLGEIFNKLFNKPSK